MIRVDSVGFLHCKVTVILPFHTLLQKRVTMSTTLSVVWRLAPMFFDKCHTLSFFFFLAPPTFWCYCILQAHHVLPYLSSKSAISPRSRGSFYWKMVFQTKIWAYGHFLRWCKNSIIRLYWRLQNWICPKSSNSMFKCLNYMNFIACKLYLNKVIYKRSLLKIFNSIFIILLHSIRNPIQIRRHKI